MKTTEIIEYLTRYQAWRRGEDGRTMDEAGIEPAKLGRVIDAAIGALGGDVCGVLVRKNQKLAAVDEHGRTTWLPDGTDYAAISSRAISDIATVTELLGVPEEEAGRPIVELVKEYLAAQSRNSVPNEQGKNRYGLDMAYFRNLFNRELNRPLVDFRPDELARVLARAARTADASVLQEAEFQAARAQSGQGAEVEGFDFDGWYDKHQSLFREGVGKSDLRAAYKQGYRDSQPQPVVPEEWREVLTGCVTCFNCPEWSDKCEEYERRARELLSTPTTPQADGWVRCEDRLPTEADADCDGCLWVCWYDNGWRMERECIKSIDCEYFAWMPTGLKRPQPPAGQEGE